MKCKPWIRHFQPRRFQCFSSQFALHGLRALEWNSILTRPENSLANFEHQISKKKLRMKRCELCEWNCRKEFSLRKSLANGCLRQNSLAIANVMAWCTQSRTAPPVGGWKHGFAGMGFCFLGAWRPCYPVPYCHPFQNNNTHEGIIFE